MKKLAAPVLYPFAFCPTSGMLGLWVFAKGK